MKVVLQRVKSAYVKVDSSVISEINHGYLLLWGIEEADSEVESEILINKILNIRVFSDENLKMNKSIIDVGGEALIVSQFTLAADTTRGNRPGFSSAAPPDRGEELYEYFVKVFERHGIRCKQGVFGGDMNVSLVNNGPTTIWIDSRD